LKIFEGIKFNRQEFSGAFGDIGTDFPLIVALILTTGLDTPSVLIVFGLVQIMTGLIYKIPMPVQPLKAMATLVIAQQISGNVLLGGGLSIGIIMLILSSTGLLTKISTVIPKAVVRGIQLGLGISLSMLALQKYIPNQGYGGLILASFTFIVIILLIDNKKYPASILALLLGFIYVFIFEGNSFKFFNLISFNLPILTFPSIEDITKGFILLALPQVPLSIGNSIIATKQIADDLFKENSITIKKIGFTYSLMNLIVPFFGGIPSCHGSGGLVGHYTFGGRTGGSVIIYGLFYVVMGLFFGTSFDEILKIFPLPVLGVILTFEGLALMVLIKDLLSKGKDFIIAMLVGIIAAGISYGFVFGLVIGTILYYLPIQLKTFINLGRKFSDN
jgi:hypothetical protein